MNIYQDKDDQTHAEAMRLLNAITENLNPEEFTLTDIVNSLNCLTPYSRGGNLQSIAFSSKHLDYLVSKGVIEQDGRKYRVNDESLLLRMITNPDHFDNDPFMRLLEEDDYDVQEPDYQEGIRSLIDYVPETTGTESPDFYEPTLTEYWEP